jgi:hypothetical protein
LACTDLQHPEAAADNRHDITPWPSYAAVSEQKKRPPVDVEAAEQLREVYHKVSYTDRATGQELLDPKKDIVKYAAVGPKGKDEQRIEFDPEEVLKIKNLGMGPCER